MCCNQWEKEKEYVWQILYTHQVHLSTKFIPESDSTDERVVKYDIPIAKILLLMIRNDKNIKWIITNEFW